MTTPKFVDLANARVDSQRAVMEEIVAAGHCPFCPEHLAKYHRQPILQRNRSWILTPSQWPYRQTEVHLLVICRRHVERLDELTYQEGADFFELLSWAQRHFGMRGGLFGMRFGEFAFSGATVRHLHGQLLVPAQDTDGVPHSIALYAGTRRTP